MKKKFIIFTLSIFFIFLSFFTYASIEYFELKNIVPINQVSLTKLKNINFRDNINIGVIGDTKEGFEVFKALVEKAKRDGCKIIIHTGDIVRFNDLRLYRYVYEEVRELVENENIPIFVLPGNHDTWRHSHRGYSNANFNKFFGGMPLFLNINNNALILINNSNYKIDNKTINLVESFLNKHKFNKKFLFAHVPTEDPRPNHSHCLNKEYAKIMENFIKKNRFDKVFFSHIHSYYTYKIKNIPCYISGGGGASLWDGNYHYLHLTIDKNNSFVKKENISWLYGLNLIDLIQMRSMEWLPYKR